MKKFIRTFKNLGQHAADLKEYMEKLPPKVAEIRQAVHMTTGQLQQLRADIHSSVTGLKTDTEDHLMDALKEINGSTEVFRQAGYELSGVDMEISPVHRLIVHLEKVADIHEASLRLLMTANQKRKTVHALLSSLIQADKMTNQVELSNLSYRKVLIHVGPVPSVRLCWRAEEVYQEESETNLPAAAMSPAADAPSTTRSLLGESSFFGERYAQKEAAPSKTGAPSPTLPSSSGAGSAEIIAPPASTGDWKKDALAKFKVMPGASKYRR